MSKNKFTLRGWILLWGLLQKIIYYTPSQIYAKVPSRTKAIF